jgi:PIN domain nuclease of toxin-antitoxin system
VIVLDTHVWLWWSSDPDRLSAAARAAIAEASEVGICTISCWELTMLARRGRIELDRMPADWVRRGLAQNNVKSVPLTAEDAVAAASVADTFAGDPADRIIYSTARRLGARLVTRDERLRLFDPQRTLW